MWECCTEVSCPIMSGGAKYEYLWADNNQYKEPTQLPAPTYIKLLLDWVDGQINDENIFPQCTDVPFPKEFSEIVKNLFKRLHRVFVHVYIHHFDEMRCQEKILYFHELVVLSSVPATNPS